jgi:putative ABC transport system ATP-binding protein
MDLHRAGQTIVLVTHDLSLAEACASRTIHLVDGHVDLDSHAQAVR